MGVHPIPFPIFGGLDKLLFIKFVASIKRRLNFIKEPLPTRAVETTHHSSPLTACIISYAAILVTPQSNEISGIPLTKIFFLRSISEVTCIVYPAPKKEFLACRKNSLHIINQLKECRSIFPESDCITIGIGCKCILLKHRSIVCKLLTGNIHNIIAKTICTRPGSKSAIDAVYQQIPGMQKIGIVIMHIGVGRSTWILCKRRASRYDGFLSTVINGILVSTAENYLPSPEGSLIRSKGAIAQTEIFFQELICINRSITPYILKHKCIHRRILFYAFHSETNARHI